MFMVLRDVRTMTPRSGEILVEYNTVSEGSSLTAFFDKLEGDKERSCCPATKYKFGIPRPWDVRVSDSASSKDKNPGRPPG